MTADHRLVEGKFDWRTEAGHCKIPVIIKGIQPPDDAVRALECGVRGIYVSNHGGRSVDHSVSTII